MTYHFIEVPAYPGALLWCDFVLWFGKRKFWCGPYQMFMWAKCGPWATGPPPLS